MEPTPAVLDYSRPEPPAWRFYLRRVFCLLLILAVITAVGWLLKAVHDAWGRRRDMHDYQTGVAALSHYVIPAGTVVFDPSVRPATTQIHFTTPNGYGWYLGPTKPNDPTVERNLSLMHRRPFLSVCPLATSLQTSRGMAFVTAGISLEGTRSVPNELSMMVDEEYFTPGTFPLYRWATHRWVTSLRFIPSGGKSFPTVLAAQPDPAGYAWTLPLIVDGRNEWVRVEHHGQYPTMTASFGRMQPGTIPYELRY